MIITGNSGTYAQVPAGSHVAVCFRVVDLGTQTETYEGNVSQKRKLLISWEIDEPNPSADNERFTISKFYTASLSPKSKLRPDLESWRGRVFTDEELKGFDIAKILGQGCMLSVAEGDNGGKSKVVGVMALPKGMKAFAGSKDPVHFSFDNFDMDSFNELPEGIQKIIMDSAEWRKMNEKPVAQPPKASVEVKMVQQKNGAVKAVVVQPEEPAGDLLDDEIPF